MTRSARRPATLDDFFAIPEEQRFHELYDGELHEKVAPTAEHGDAQSGVVTAVRPYHRAGVSHYWLADPREGTLTVMRHSPDGYVTLQTAERHETIRPEPFEAIELFVGSLFGEDPPET